MYCCIPHVHVNVCTDSVRTFTSALISASKAICNLIIQHDSLTMGFFGSFIVLSAITSVWCAKRLGITCNHLVKLKYAQ